MQKISQLNSETQCPKNLIAIYLFQQTVLIAAASYQFSFDKNTKSSPHKSVTCNIFFNDNMIETERKFLVRNDSYKQQAFTQKRIAQGYLSSVPDRTVRVRTKGDQGFLTIKGKSSESGMSRMEWEKEISVADAQQLLAICEKGAIDKIRHEVKVGNHTYEVDEFFGDNAGLTVAEIELTDENEEFIKPEWLGEEVTGTERYYNAYLSRNPYNTWQ